MSPYKYYVVVPIRQDDGSNALDVGINDKNAKIFELSEYERTFLVEELSERAAIEKGVLFDEEHFNYIDGEEVIALKDLAEEYKNKCPALFESLCLAEKEMLSLEICL